MPDTLRQPPDRLVRPVSAGLAYYHAPAPPADRADLEWAVGQAVEVPGPGGGLCRVAGVGTGPSGELALVVTNEVGVEHRLSVLWRPADGSAAGSPGEG